MKKLLVIALALFTLNGVAQQTRKGNEDKKDRLERIKEMTPQEMADLKSKRLTLALDLSDAQQKEVHQLILIEATERQEMKAERQATKTEDSKPSKEELLKIKNQRLDNQIEMKRKMKSILSAEQYAKFEKMNQRKRGKKGRKKYEGKKRQ